MIIILDDSHKADLQFLREQSPDVVNEFVNISLEFLRKGSNPKLYLGAAKSLGVDVGQVEAVVEGIAQLFSEASRLMVSEQDFLATLLVLGFSTSLNGQLKELYLLQRPEIRTIQRQLSVGLPHYRNLDWRLEVQLASRTLHNQLEPTFTLCFHTEENGEKRTHYLQTDYVNLKHVAEELEVALKEIKSPYCRRLMRNIK